MSRSPRALAIPLGVAIALALAACGADDERDSVAALTPPPPATTQATVPTTTGTTTPATTGTTTTPPSPTTTTTPSSGGAPASTTTTPPSGGAGVTTPTTTQPSGTTPATCADAVGGFISGVRASGTDCAVAGEVARAWFDAIDGGAAPDAPITAAGFACGGTLAGQVASVSCEGEGGRVTFTASP